MQYGETGQHSDEVGHNVDSHALVGSYDIERLLATDGDIYGAYNAAAKYRLVAALGFSLICVCCGVSKIILLTSKAHLASSFSKKLTAI